MFFIIIKKDWNKNAKLNLGIMLSYYEFYFKLIAIEFIYDAYFWLPVILKYEFPSGIVYVYVVSSVITGEISVPLEEADNKDEETYKVGIPAYWPFERSIFNMTVDKFIAVELNK